MSLNHVGELEAIRRSAGGLTPERVVERASDPKSALHSQFEWNDGEAAHRYRLHQARGLIRAVVSIVEGPNHEPMKIRAYVSLPSDRVNGFGYRATVDVLADPNSAVEALAALKADLDRLRMKYAAFGALAETFEAIERVVGSDVATQRRRRPRDLEDRAVA